MKRKLIAFVLVFALLASLSPAVAADEISGAMFQDVYERSQLL